MLDTRCSRRPCFWDGGSSGVEVCGPENVDLNGQIAYLYVNNDLRQDVKAVGNSFLGCGVGAGGAAACVLREAGGGAASAGGGGRRAVRGDAGGAASGPA